MQILSDLVYTRRGERSLALDLYVPERARATVVWIHGGAWPTMPPTPRSRC